MDALWPVIMQVTALAFVADTPLTMPHAIAAYHMCQRASGNRGRRTSTATKRPTTTGAITVVEPRCSILLSTALKMA